MAYAMFRFGGQQLGYLMAFVGKNVRINRGGPESVMGQLIAVQSDYIVLRTKDGFVYVNAAHIKSITEGKSTRTSGRTAGRSGGYIAAASFNDLLRRLRQQFVQINQGGPEKVTGFVAEVGSEALLLVSGRDVIRIPLFHIRTVSLAQQTGGRDGGSDNRNQQRSQGQRTGGAQYGGSRGRQGTQGRRQEGGSRGHQGSRDHHGSRGHQGSHGRQGNRGAAKSGGRKR
jgi:hypothetical protein